MESRLSKATGETSAFSDPIENSITCIGIFQKVELPDILRNRLQQYLKLRTPNRIS